MSNDPLLPPSHALCRKCFYLRLLSCLLWAFIMLFLSLAPDPPQVTGVLGWDKLNHALAYGLLAFLLARCFHQWHGPDAVVGVRVWLLAMAYGGFLEIMQMAMQAGRTAEWLDLLADGIGVTLVCVLLRHSKLRKLVQARTFTELT